MDVGGVWSWILSISWRGHPLSTGVRNAVGQKFCWGVEFRRLQRLQRLWGEGKARPVYCEVLSTIRKHFEGICNYFLNRTTSGVMEGINNRIKLIKLQAYGFANFGKFRSRVIACFSN